MDFNTFKQKFSETTQNLTEKAKELGNKTLEFAGDTLAKTPAFIQTEDEMKKELEKKRAIFIAFDEKTEIEKELMILFPFWWTKSFIDGASFSFLNQEKSEMLIRDQKFSLPLEMRVYFHGVETQRFSTMEEMKKWWAEEEWDYEWKNLTSTKSSTEPSTTSTEDLAKNKENSSNFDATSTKIVDPLVEQK